MKKILIVLLVCMFLMCSVQGAEMGDIYLETKDEFADIVKKLYEGGATDENIMVFFDDVQQELILNCTDLNEENYDEKLQEAIITALKYSSNVNVYNALVSKFSAEAVYFLKHNEIPESLTPLYTKMKDKILGNEELMYKISAMFSDQREFLWAMPAVEALVGSGILKGYPDKTFGGNKNITRAEFTKMAVMAFVGNNTEAASSFADVNAEDWFYSYVSTAAQAGVVKGFEGNVFKPEENITRQDMAVIIYNVLGTQSGGTAEFSDSDEISGYAMPAVSSLYLRGIISGMGNGKFMPREYATRAQAAMMIYNAMGK